MFSSLLYTFIPSPLSAACWLPRAHCQSQLQVPHDALSQKASLPLLTPGGPYWDLTQDTDPLAYPRVESGAFMAHASYKVQRSREEGAPLVHPLGHMQLSAQVLLGACF